MSNKQAYFAEAIATFGLVFIGAGVVLADAVSGGKIGILGVAIAHGLVLMCMIYATAHISGAHINPAVTIGLLITKNIKAAKAMGYIASQLVGAIVAAVLLKIIFVSAPTTAYLGTPVLASGLSVTGAIIVEAILTFFLVFTIFGVAVDKRAPSGVYGAAIGLVLTFDILVGGILTGAAMNPARAFGPALVSGHFTNHLVYWIGPILGGIVAALMYSRFLLSTKKQ
ncbi:MAG: aquaporin [Nanoarchaeota archaeon]|nr:aquaporin [Nanoarchaeota archaeon]